MAFVSLTRRIALSLGLLVVALEGALYLAGLFGFPLGPRPSLLTAATGVLIVVLARTARSRGQA